MIKKKILKNKKRTGFTLVELLAVIVILAIIMIIAIPAVLNTMQASKRKSLVTFAQKAMNEAEKQYLSKQAFGELTLNGTVSAFYFDIKKDLGLTNTGNYNGVVTIGISDLEENYKEIFVYDDEYVLSYSTWRNTQVLDENLVRTFNKSYYPSDLDFNSIEWKKIKAAKDHCSLCGWYDTTFTDGVTNTKLYDNNISHRSNYTVINGVEVCNDAEKDNKLFDQVLYTYYFNYDKLADCDYIRNLS